jgi:hypothetical protein
MIQDDLLIMIAALTRMINCDLLTYYQLGFLYPPWL